MERKISHQSGKTTNNKVSEETPCDMSEATRPLAELLLQWYARRKTEEEVEQYVNKNH